MQDRLSVVSLFAGAGGFDHGFHQAGFTTVLASELLESGSETLANYFDMDIVMSPYCPKFNGDKKVIQGDIKNVDFSNYDLQPDVVIGGPPCQDFSRIRGGNEQGLNGGRGKLYAEFVRAVMFLQPKFFVFENVPGLVSANEGVAYQTIQNDFQNLTAIQKHELEKESDKVPQNEIFSYRLLHNSIVFAPNIGVPQQRKRLIIIGIRQDLVESLDDIEIIEKSFFNNINGVNSIFKKFPLTLIEAFEGKALNELGDHYRNVMCEYEEIAKSEEIPNVNDWLNRKWNLLSFDIIKDYYQACGLNYDEEFDEDEFSSAMEVHSDLLEELGWLDNPIDSINNASNLHTSLRVQERMSRIPPGENYKFVDDTQWEVAGHNISLIYRRADPIKPAWTVVAYGGGGTYGYHYKRSRAQLTLREKARIQTFPDDLSFSGNKSEIRAQIGEAVPPLLGKIIAEQIKKVLVSLNQAM